MLQCSYAKMHASNALCCGDEKGPASGPDPIGIESWGGSDAGDIGEGGGH
jgi:hypothetical protein